MPLTLTEKLDSCKWTTGDRPAVTLDYLPAGDAEDRIANATEETARNTKKLLDKARNGGLAFE